MKVAVYYSNSDIRIEEMPVPAIGEGEILVRVEASGICGTDCLEWYRINRVPLVLGHEIAGVVVETGKNAKGFKQADKVVVAHHVPCGKCRFCRAGHETVCDTLRKTNFDPGGFAQFVRVPKINVEKGTFRIPGNVSFEEATFAEPLACAIRGQRLMGLKRGASVLIIGSGISGLLHIQLAKLAGARNIIATDIIPYRLKMAKKFGANYALNGMDHTPDLLRDLNGGHLADCVIISAGVLQAFEQGLTSVERGGTVLVFAAAPKDALLPVSINDIFWRNEITVMSSYAGSPKDHMEAINRISSRKINVRDMITHRLGLNETGKGFKLVAEARESVKVIIEPQK
jgi:L-iditol 2-dehydrogenase